MTTQHDKAKRWRPRFSVRTLAIVVTLVCCYAACWGPTKWQGLLDVQRNAWSTSHSISISIHDASVVAPLFIRQDEIVWEPIQESYPRRYYFWFFGYVAKLPYEREFELEEFLMD